MTKTIETEIEIDAPPSVVWELLMKPSEWETWNNVFQPKNEKFVVGEAFEFHMNPKDDPKAKAAVAKPKCVTRDDTSYLLEWRGGFGAEFLFVAVHTWKLEALDNGTRTKVIQCEDMKGYMMPLLKMAGQVAIFTAAFVRVNEALKKKVEGAK